MTTTTTALKVERGILTVPTPDMKSGFETDLRYYTGKTYKTAAEAVTGAMEAIRADGLTEVAEDPMAQLVIQLSDGNKMRHDIVVFMQSRITIVSCDEDEDEAAETLKALQEATGWSSAVEGIRAAAKMVRETKATDMRAARDRAMETVSYCDMWLNALNEAEEREANAVDRTYESLLEQPDLGEVRATTPGITPLKELLGEIVLSGNWVGTLANLADSDLDYAEGKI